MKGAFPSRPSVGSRTGTTSGNSKIRYAKCLTRGTEDMAVLF